MFVSMHNPWILDSVAVEESHCYNEMRALPADVIAHCIDNPSYMQWDSTCDISARFFNVPNSMCKPSRSFRLESICLLTLLSNIFLWDASKRPAVKMGGPDASIMLL